MHRHLVATGFQAIGLLTGIPCAIAFVYCSWQSIRLFFADTHAAAESGRTGNDLIDGFVFSFRLFAKGLGFLTGAAQWILLLVTAVLFGVTLFSAAVFVTGRGLSSGRGWARVAGIILALFPLFVSIGVALSAERTVATFIATLAGAVSLYVLWVLLTRFA